MKLSAMEIQETEPLSQEPGATRKSSSDSIHMKKELGLLEGVAIIVGIIIGSGIFISPKGVIQEVNSVGLSLIVWVLCGLMSMVGALCYAELGTSIPKSGSDYAYIQEAFGPFPAFLYLWDANFVFVPTTNAIMALTVANYLVQPFFPECDAPPAAISLIAAACICGLTFLNCYSMKITTKLQNMFMFTKIAAVFLVIVIGSVGLFQGGYKKFENSFENSQQNPGNIALSFYSGIYSYAGWNYLNFMTEELQDPHKNLPRAIYISLPIVTFLYTLANVAYLAVLDPTAMISSNAIAVTFAQRMIGAGAAVMPILVAISALGGLSCHIMTSSRLCFVGARQGHIPDSLALVTIKSYTPTPALVFLGALSLIYLCTNDVYILINYSSFVESCFIMLSISSLLYLRWKQPDMNRPIKVNIGIPILFLFICSFLVFLPFYADPVVIGMALLITSFGIPVYYVGVVWKKKPNLLRKIEGSFTKFSQILFLAVKEDKVD